MIITKHQFFPTTKFTANHSLIKVTATSHKRSGHRWNCSCSCILTKTRLIGTRSSFFRIANALSRTRTSPGSHLFPSTACCIAASPQQPGAPGTLVECTPIFWYPTTVSLSHNWQQTRNFCKFMFLNWGPQTSFMRSGTRQSWNTSSRNCKSYIVLG